MAMPSLSGFRLVGGTALSLLQGHRKSEDIDLFCHQPYGSVDFSQIEFDIKEHFPYFINDDDILGLRPLENNFGLHLHLGNTETSAIKTDIINWTVADFIDPYMEINGIRIASIREIALMKLDAISRGGRKKDFWDLTEIFEQFSLPDLLALYLQKYPYNSIDDVKSGLTRFESADNMPDPICLRGKYWETVKNELVDAVKHL